MNAKTFSFTFEVGEIYTDGYTVAKIAGFETGGVMLDDGKESHKYVEVVNFLDQWWRVKSQ